VTGVRFVLRGKIAVSRIAWDTVRQLHNIEEQHYVLHVETPNISLEDYPAVRQQAFEELGRAGLANGDNVDPDLLDAMRLVAAAPLELHGWVSQPDRPTLSVVAASTDRNAMLYVGTEEDFQLWPISTDKLAASVVGLMPPLRPGEGHSISVPLSAYREIVETGGYRDPKYSMLESNRRPSRLETDCRELLSLLRQRRLGGGRIYAAARPRTGSRRKSQYPVTYLDTESGRWLLKYNRGYGGDLWVVFAPATADLLVRELNVLLDAL